MHLQVRCWLLDLFTTSFKAAFFFLLLSHVWSSVFLTVLGREMRAEVLVIWVSVTLCCALVRAREDVQEDAVSRDLAQVKQPRGAVERGRQVEEGGGQMSDQPAEVVAEKAKPKKKKTPEEIEAGRQQLFKDGLCCDVTSRGADFTSSNLSVSFLESNTMNFFLFWHFCSWLSSSLYSQDAEDTQTGKGCNPSPRQETVCF